MSCRDRHGGATGFTLGQFAVHGAFVVFIFAQSQVEDVEQIEHASEHLVQGVDLPEGVGQLQNGPEEEVQVVDWD